MPRTLAFEPASLTREIALKGLTLEEFADVAEISLPTLYRALKGNVLTPRCFTDIIKALGSLPSIDVPEGLVKSA